MNAKRIIFMLSFALLFFTMTACATITPQEQSSGNYEVYLCNKLLNGGRYLDASTPVHTFTAADAMPAPTDRVKTVRINGQDNTMNYASTSVYAYGLYTHRYATADGDMECYFWSDTDKLARITLNNQNMEVFAAMGQTQYTQWVQDFAEQFSEENWDQLLFSCGTSSLYTTENAAERRTVREFIASFEENEQLMSYSFAYDKYIGGMPTTDTVYAYFGFEDQSITVWLNRHNFDSFPSTGLDEGAIDTALASFVNSYVVNSARLDHFRFRPEKIICVEGNYYYLGTLNLYFVGYPDPLSGYELIIDIPDP